MVSFAWYRDATRHLRHVGFQIFAHPVGSTSDDRATAPFAIEEL